MRETALLPGPISEQVDARRRVVREAKERFQSAFDHAPIGMALVALDGSFLQVNTALARILGRRAHDQAGLRRHGPRGRGQRRHPPGPPRRRGDQQSPRRGTPPPR